MGALEEVSEDASEGVPPDVAEDRASDSAYSVDDGSEDMVEVDCTPNLLARTPLDSNLDNPPESNDPCTIPASSLECGPLSFVATSPRKNHGARVVTTGRATA